jgi:anaerobic magnesium-protoporphyrin IX monomethyl ester cyclase
MKILFLNPNWNLLPARQFPGCKRPHHPLELLYPATILAAKHTVVVVDAFLERLDDEELGKKIGSSDPDVVVIATAPSYLFWRCCPFNISLPKRVTEIVKHNSQASVIIIGPHPSVSPEWVLEECQADFLIRGEAEIELTEFINSELKNGQVPGLFSNQLNNGLAVIEDMSLLPKIDFSLLPLGPYHSHSPKYDKGASVEFSRGCIFHCPFCFKQSFRNKYRARPAKKVLDEIKDLKNQGYQYIYFIDELFNYDTQELRDLLKGLEEIKIGWGSQCRPDIITRELLVLMKNAGCVDIEYGLETLNQKASEFMSKNRNKDLCLSNINLTAEFGIRTTAFFIYGAPDESLDNLKEIFKSLSWLDRRVYFSSALLIPYPTTAIYQSIKGNREHLGKDDWKECEELIGKTSAIPREDLEKILILSHISNHLRRLRIPKMFISGLIIFAGYLPARIFGQFFDLLLAIRKDHDIQ